MPIWPLAVYFVAILVVVGVMLGLSYLLGERHRERETGEPFESGVTSTGPGRVRLTARFYLVAMFFVIFDLEAVFLVAWSLTARELGWPGYIEVVIFTVILLIGLFYLWRVGALDWGPDTMRRRRESEK
ncbi:MAG TPA: NADH-quinone oxidoreductase subunit A [Candidatus Binatia bacterium]|jgi:NADH-quinone oxidoreductase subunit A|nr:NADH-quinone oxidoreductase subunit A [Candidatus Binatia bacterium]